MQVYKVMLASVAAGALLFSADVAEAQKAKIAGGVLLTAAEFKALGSSEKTEFNQRAALETSARSRIFKAAKSGRFNTVGERFLASLVHEGLFLSDEDFNVSHSDGDVLAEIGLDRFVGGSSTDVKFNVARFLPSLTDSEGNRLDSSILSGISAGSGGLKINKNGISYNEETGDVTVSLKTVRGGFKHNQFVNLRLNLDGYGKVDMTYWLNELRPTLIESETTNGAEFDGDGPATYSASFQTFIDNINLGDDGDTNALFTTAVAVDDNTVDSINYTSRVVNATSPFNGFGALVGFVTDGKMLRGFRSNFISASPSS